MKRPMKCKQSCQVPTAAGWTEFHVGTVYDVDSHPELDEATIASYFEDPDNPSPREATRATVDRRGGSDR